jgi:hypothetical protein
MVVFVFLHCLDLHLVLSHQTMNSGLHIFL